MESLLVIIRSDKLPVFVKSFFHDGPVVVAVSGREFQAHVLCAISHRKAVGEIGATLQIRIASTHLIGIHVLHHIAEGRQGRGIARHTGIVAPKYLSHLIREIQRRTEEIFLLACSALFIVSAHRSCAHGVVQLLHFRLIFSEYGSLCRVHRYLGLCIPIVHIIHGRLIVLHAYGELASPQRTLVDGFANYRILVALGLREYLYRCLSLFRHGISALHTTSQISTHHIEVQMLLILQIQLIVDIERRNAGAGRFAILHLIHPVFLIKETVSVGKGVRDVLDIVSNCNVQHALFAIGKVIVERSGDIIVFDTIGGSYEFLIINNLIRIIKHLLILPIPLQVTTAPLHQGRERRLTPIILARHLIIAEARKCNPIGQVGRDITTRIPATDNVIHHRCRTSVTQARLFVILHSNDIFRTDSDDFRLRYLYPIDA